MNELLNTPAGEVGSTLVAINILGLFLKSQEWLPNKYIPLILLGLGLAAHLSLHGLSTQNAIEGVIAVVGAVGAHSAVKNSLGKKPDEQSKPPTPPTQ